MCQPLRYCALMQDPQVPGHRPPPLPPLPPPPPPPPQWQTLHLASANLLNLALPARSFYVNQDPYSHDEYERKLDWLGGMFHRLAPDVMGVQEVWDEAALKAAIARSGLQR